MIYRNYARINDKVLFVVAGPKKSGKSTLISKLIRNRDCIFGEEFYTRFSQFRIFDPPSLEERSSVDDILAGRHWFGARHIPSLISFPAPSSTLLHLDLMSEYLIGVPSIKDHNNLRNFYSVDRLVSCYDKKLTAFFALYDKCIIVTLYTRIETAMARHNLWTKVNGFEKRTHFHVLYSETQPDRESFGNIYIAWERYLQNNIHHKILRVSGE